MLRGPQPERYLLREHTEVRKQAIDELRRAIQIGLDQLARGEAKVYDDDTLHDLFEEIKERGREKLARQRKQHAGWAKEDLQWPHHPHSPKR
jgi:hypothetical protein